MLVYGFRFYFTPLTGVLFTFPSRYLFTIGSCLVFSLGSWSTLLPTGFLVPRRTLGDVSTSPIYFAYGGFTLFARLSQNLSAINRIYHLPALRRHIPLTPYKGLGSSNFARRYFRNLLFDFFSLSYLDGSVHSVSLYVSI